MIHSILLKSSRIGRFTKTTILTATLCMGMASAVQAESHEGDEAVVSYRQTVMSIVGSNMGAMADIMKYRLDLPGHIGVHAGQMADMAQLIAPAFKKNIPTRATDAKPEIWKDWTKFEAAIVDFEEAARNLESAAQGPDAAAVGPAMKALGKTCGGCHKQFRRPKEESFKRNLQDPDDHE